MKTPISLFALVSFTHCKSLLNDYTLIDGLDTQLACLNSAQPLAQPIAQSDSSADCPSPSYP